MRISIVFLALVFTASQARAESANVGKILLGEDSCQVNRDQDVLKPLPGTELQAGDIIKCVGRTHAKALIDGKLVLFGPLSETQITSTGPLLLSLSKGSLRVISDPSSRSDASFTIKTGKATITSPGGDIFARYNGSSEFSEVACIDGRATAGNTLGTTGSTDLGPKESTLLSPESAPTQAASLQPNEIKEYTRDTEYNSAPLANGDLYTAIQPTMQRLERSFGEARRKLARPSLPENAPFRSLDSRRQAFAAPGFDQPDHDVAPGRANIEIEWTQKAPVLR